MVNVLWVGDEEEVPDALESSKVNLRVAPTPEEAFEQLDGVDSLVCGHSVGGMCATEVFERVRGISPDVSCVLFNDAEDEGKVGDSDVVFDYVPQGDADYLLEVLRNSAGKKTQVSYPLPEDEEERLRELSKYDVDHVSVRETFDRLTTLSARYFDADWSFVGLVDEHKERFLSCYGYDIDELDREDTVCTYSILEDGLTVVENISEDPRFESNQALAELGMKTYAGAPITTPSGAKVGSFCVLTEEERSFTEEELDSLRLFAEEVSEQMRLRAILSESKKNSGTPPTGMGI